MAFIILRDIAKNIYDSIFYLIMADCGNKEQFIICFRWVDKGFNAHEDFTGINNVDNMKADTLAIILSENLKAFFTHSFGHALNLAVEDMVKNVQLLKDNMDAKCEILLKILSNLIKKSHKRDAMLQKIQKDILLEYPGFRVLFPTRWTVRAESMKGILDNWVALQQVWDESLDGNLEPEIKSRIIGVKSQMTTFDYFYRVTIH